MMLEGEELEKKVLGGIGMDRAQLDQGVLALRHWLEKQPHLPHTADDIELELFIIGAKSVERAKEKLDAYYTARSKYPDIFQSRNPSTLNWASVANQLFAHLPSLTPEGYMVLIFTIPPSDTLKDYSFSELCRLFFMTLDQELRERRMSSGHLVIVDVKNLSFEYTKKISLVTLAHTFNSYQYMYPVRLKKLIYINAPSTVEVFLNTFIRPFAKEKIKARIVVYSEGAEILKTHLPLEMLPKDYGGNAPCLEKLSESMRERVMENTDWLAGDGSRCSDENRRPAPDSDVLGLQGTFRKLAVD